MPRGGLLWFGLGQALVTAAGVGFGAMAGHPGDPPHVFTVLGVLPLAGLGVGMAQAIRRSGGDRWAAAAGTFGAGVYCCWVMVSEPFLWPPTTAEGLVGKAAWIVPLPLAGLWLARRRLWWPAAGMSVFLFGCVALLTFNMHWLDVAGFLSRIRR